MNNQTILIKQAQRLDKLSSADFGNVEDWMYIEAFNKALSDWFRRQLEGVNQEKTTAEGSLRRIDDLQFSLTNPTQLTSLTKSDIFYSSPLPTDYMGWCKVSVMGKNECCPDRKFIVFIGTEADSDINLLDSGKQPSFEWATTFATLASNEIKIYTNNAFDVSNAYLTYYKVPQFIEISGVANPYTGVASTVDVLCNAPDNVIEVIIEESCGILASDIKSYQEAQMNYQMTDKNT